MMNLKFNQKMMLCFVIISYKNNIESQHNGNVPCLKLGGVYMGIHSIVHCVHTDLLGILLNCRFLYRYTHTFHVE